MTSQRFNQCIESLAKGDINALASIYEEYFQKMIGAAFLIVKNYHDAENVASSVLIKINN